MVTARQPTYLRPRAQHPSTGVDLGQGDASPGWVEKPKPSVNDTALAQSPPPPGTRQEADIRSWQQVSG